jgi:hypothetical protein
MTAKSRRPPPAGPIFGRYRRFRSDIPGCVASINGMGGRMKDDYQTIFS